MAHLIGTAGHVDHGKSSLIRALTGVDPDRLPEEKARGMTIDLGFSAIRLPKAGLVSIVDVPGHQKFLTNMLVGALGMDVGLLCVAADEGIKPQTEEHIHILHALEVNQLVVALTKADLVGPEAVKDQAARVAEFLSELGYADVPIIPASSTTRLGLAEIEQELDLALARCAERPTGPWYLPVDRVFKVRGQGIVVTGTLGRGEVRVGGEAAAEPGGLRVRIRGIQVHNEHVERAEAGQRVGLNISGPDAELVTRALLLAAVGSVSSTNRLEVRMRWASEVPHASAVRVSVGAEEAMGTLFRSTTDSKFAQLALDREVGSVYGQSVIVRRVSPPTLVGAGWVTTVVAGRRRWNDPVSVATEGADLESRIHHLVRFGETGMELRAVAQRLGVHGPLLEGAVETLVSSNLLVRLAGWMMTPDQVAQAEMALLTALSRCHAAEKSSSFVARDSVFQRSGLSLPDTALIELTNRLVERGDAVASGALLRLSNHTPQLPDRQRKLLDLVKGVIQAGEASPPSLEDVALSLRVPVQAVTEIVRVGSGTGELVRIADGIYYTKEWLGVFVARLHAEMAGKSFVAGEFRVWAGTSRKYAIPLLEWLDSKGHTIRRGDARWVRDSPQG